MFAHVHHTLGEAIYDGSLAAVLLNFWSVVDLHIIAPFINFDLVLVVFRVVLSWFCFMFLDVTVSSGSLLWFRVMKFFGQFWHC